MTTALDFNPNHDELGRFAEGGSASRDLTGTEAAALRAYAGNGYGQINTTLRNPSARLDEAEYTQDLIAGIDSAFTAAAPLAQPAKVYRGMRTSRIPEPGQVYSDAGYVSTSLSLSAAEYFGEGDAVTIMIPKGARVLNVTGRGIGQHQEKEILLPRGSRFKVKTVDSNGNPILELIT